MNQRLSISLLLGAAFAVAVIIELALTLPGGSSATAWAQSVIPTPTATSTPTLDPDAPTATFTPTPTDTPVPPTPTDTPVSRQLSFTVDDITTEPPGSVAMINQEINFTLVFTDPAVSVDTYTIHWDWGDGTSSSWTYQSVLCPIDEIEQLTVCTVTGSHTYAADDPDVYTIGLVVTADDERSSEPVSLYVVTYDPNAGFVTGGGWIDSPPGACHFGACTQGTVGKASFGFVSKYKKGASTPDGNTEFQFKAGDLNFHSVSYDWLVVAGHKAMYKGVGTINGSGNYGFMLSAIDEKLTPSTDVDLFRIKIWDRDAGDEIVYDNQMGEASDADPTTAIGGGSIVIHKGK